jgi:hypothetical protein
MDAIDIVTAGQDWGKIAWVALKMRWLVLDKFLVGGGLDID